ncbi:hypothetical protein SCG7109_AO_00070 [Chlamydiales bacterium SCGC AG-110-M15]|nr:hypothetical protein SCG7109_AO_00070 [Chlamydiales bacterium SCGC AG-110-M15]
MSPNRVFVFILSLITLVLSGLFASYLIRSKQTLPPRLQEALSKPVVSVVTLQSQDHPINVYCYGTAIAEKTVTLSAAVPGKILEAEELYPGKDVSPDDLLFQIEKTKIDFAIRQLTLEQKDLTLQRKGLEIRCGILNAQVQNAKEQYELNVEALKSQTSNYQIEMQLFNKTKTLFEQKNISNTEYLRREASLRSAEQAFINAKQELEGAEDSISQLELSLTTASIDKEQILNNIEVLGVKIEDLKDDREKSDVRVDFPAEVIATHVYDSQEVSVGTKLADVRSTDGVEIHVNIPDNNFRWLYAGDLLENPNDHPVRIRLVNDRFHKRFSNAWIKSTGEGLNIPTRSLPLVVGRKNPRDEVGQIIAKDELKPGMYCEVLVELCKAKNSFLIPYEAIQEHQRLFYVTMDGDEDTMTLSIIDDFEILHEEEDGLIVRLPDHYQHLLLVSHAFKKGKAGMLVTIDKLE